MDNFFEMSNLKVRSIYLSQEKYLRVILCLRMDEMN